MKSINLLSIMLAFFCFLAVNCQNKKKESTTPKIQTAVEIPDLQKAEKVLARAKILVQSLKDSEDPFGLKKVFPISQITLATYDGAGGWNFEFNGGDGPFRPIFLLPTQADFDKGCNLPAVMVTKTGIVNGVEIPFVIINPRWLQLAQKEVDLDYLGSCMPHEGVHCWQIIVAKLGQRPQLTAQQREREAYNFQFQFIPIILERNGIKGAQAPSGRLHINSHQDMVDAAAVVDKSNGGKLGMLSNLVLQDAFLEKCLPFLTLPDPDK